MSPFVRSPLAERLRGRDLWRGERQEDVVRPEELHGYVLLWQNWLISVDEELERAFFGVNLGDLIPTEHLSLRETTDITSQIEKLFNWLRQKAIIIRQPAVVRDYLLRYPDTIDVLPSLSRTALEQFGIATQLSLEPYRDPEIEDEYLTLYVRQKEYDERIMDIVEEICSAHEEELAEMSGWLVVTTDFRPPR